MISVTRRAFCAAPANLKGLSKSKPHLLLLMAGQHRGEEWVKAGQLAARRKSHLYSPDYPKSTAKP